ncbi:zeta toxin family protein [Verticillium alfalfae VaMs.102]|uniref:Zeta toxin family protein n=1 Tax=Verticillium alfalfae (strain VaMs.102 / ATCC MYA-4576 / FGSC 10136) TaxID=526221 RepID=C9SP65_VERA1|nr:zeta toxin family protein [Verticillium alfalfae VaMs.102]EEY20580.1 zeta toxin family protein [Verticillium alfalfae VaMs.102]
MPPPPDLTSYILSTQTSDDIFKSQILPAEFPLLVPAPQTQAGQRPLAVLITLQNVPSLVRNPNRLASDGTSSPRRPQVPDARRWLRLAAATLRPTPRPPHRVRVPHPDDFTALAAALHDAGYRVEVVVLAVPRPLSRLGILTRFHEKLPEAGSRGLPVRLTPIKVHDDSYNGLLNAAQWIDEHPETVDQVLVVRRGNLVAFCDAKERPDGKLKGQAAAAIVRERERPLTDVEKNTAAEDLAKLEKRDTALAQELRSMLAPLLAEIDPSSLQQLLPLEFPTERCRRDATLWLGNS